MTLDPSDELNQLLSSGKKGTKDINSNSYGNRPSYCGPPSDYDDIFSDDDEDFTRSYTQWTSSDGRTFIPAARTRQKLTPGVYEVRQSPNIGIYFNMIPTKVEGLLRFPDTNSDKVISEIMHFWESESVFRTYGLPYKRGILLWGPPGSGKSCTVQLIIADIIKRGGIVVRFTNPHDFLDGMRTIRLIEPETPIVVIMEDIDSIIKEYHESEVLNILDGVNSVEKVVFLATTNYPEELGARIVNRPSRFDKRFKIGFPTAKGRKLYLEHIIGNGNVKDGRAKIKELKIDIRRWIQDTDEMSIAHLKELFVATIIMGDNYEDAIAVLKTMQEDVRASDPDAGQFGFGHKVKVADDEPDWSDDD